MKEDFHVDVRGRIIKYNALGIALVGSIKRKHIGCVISSKLKKEIKRKLCNNKRRDYAK